TSSRHRYGVVSPTIRRGVSDRCPPSRPAAPRSLRSTAHVPCAAPLLAATSSAGAAPKRAPHRVPDHSALAAACAADLACPALGACPHAARSDRRGCRRALAPRTARLRRPHRRETGCPVSGDQK